MMNRFTERAGQTLLRGQITQIVCSAVFEGITFAIKSVFENNTKTIGSLH